MTAGLVATPDVSVVVACYNAEDFVEATIQSALSQPEVVEVVVVDDGSSDGSLRLLEQIAAGAERVKLVAKENGGVASARNRGVDLVSPSSRYLLFLDADDLLIDGAVRTLRNRLEERPECPVAHGVVELIDKTGEASPERNWEIQDGRLAVPSEGLPLPRKIGRLPDAEDTALNAIALRNPIATPGQALIRKDAFERTQGFDTAATYAEDWDLWLSLIRFGTFAFVGKPVIEYRRHAGGASSRAMGRIRLSDRYIRRKWIRQPDATDTFRHVVRRSWIAYELDRAKERAAMARDAGKLAVRELLRSGSSTKELVVACVSGRRLRR